MIQVAGVTYVVNSFLLLVAPDVANIAFLVPAFVGELSLALWLLVKGVDASNTGTEHRSDIESLLEAAMRTRAWTIRDVTVEPAPEQSVDATY